MPLLRLLPCVDKGVNLGDGPVEFSFDNIFSDKYNGMKSKSHFQPGSLVADDVPYREPPRILTTSRARRMEPPPRAKFLGRSPVQLARSRELTGPWRVTPIKDKTSWDRHVWNEIAPAGLSSGPRSPLSLAMITHGHSTHGPAGGAQVWGGTQQGSRAPTPSGSPKHLLHTFSPAMAAVAEVGA